MSERARGIRKWTILIGVTALLAFSGLALAQEGDTTDEETRESEDQGPPWLRPEFADSGWTPGTPGPPPWAGQDDGDDGEGPPWLRPEFADSGWTPGTPGPPPWAGQDDEGDEAGQGPPWLRPEFADSGWTPGTPGPPPWAGQDDDGDGDE